jgi:hypothetical protein
MYFEQQADKRLHISIRDTHDGITIPVTGGVLSNSPTKDVKTELEKFGLWKEPKKKSH